MLIIKHEVSLKSEIKLLKQWLPRISTEERAYLKGASKALLYAQENEVSKLEEQNEKDFY